jgi:hypothetical protein
MPLRYRIVNPSLWLQGLLIVLALLGHDLLMASHAPVTAIAPATGGIHQYSSTHSVVDKTAALQQGQRESPHPSFCGIGGTALFPPVDQLGVTDLNVTAAIASSHLPASAHARTLLWEEPRWPPGTCRALLQVYRI